jgi:dipeptidyl aminopeptidase/acylaminoacyl peptidase
MSSCLRGFFVVCVSCVVSFQAFAGGAAAIPASDFARPAQITLPSLSPDGQYIAASVRDKVDADDGSKYTVGVFHVPDMKPVGRMMLQPSTIPLQIIWTSNTRLIILTAKEVGWLEGPAKIADLISVNADGSNQHSMFGWGTRNGRGLPFGRGGFSGLPPTPNGHFYWTSSTNNDNISAKGTASVIRIHGPSDMVSDVFDVDSETGDAKLIGTFSKPGMQFVIHDDTARIAYGVDDHDHRMVFIRDNADQPWRQIDGTSAVPLRISEDGTHAYWLYGPNGAPDALAYANLDLSNLKILASDNFGGIGAQDVSWTPYPQKPFAATVETGRPKTIYVDDDNWATIHKALSEQYPDYAIKFAGMSGDGTRVLVYAYSDKDPGFYALFTLTPVSLTPLFRVLPWIDPHQMASRQPIRFKTRDGLDLDGYLTMPAKGKNLPLVILPHGGPIDIRDKWNYDAWPQFLANLGYAVLQVNYRGSAGRGKGFRLAGYRQFGTGIQQDLIDAVHWAVDQGYADKNRVCTFGASFGGYSALMLPIRSPGTFKCAIDYAGVSDFTIIRDDPEQQHSDYAHNVFNEQIGLDDQTIKAISPLYHLDDFNVPVLIVHGEKDPRVPVKNAEVLRDALEKSGKPYEWLVKPKELHGFYSEADNTDFLQQMQAFLAKYLGN